MLSNYSIIEAKHIVNFEKLIKHVTWVAISKFT